MELEKKLQEEFPDHKIKLEHQFNDPTSYEHWNVIFDGKKLKVRFKDWSQLFEEYYNLDIKDEIFQQIISEIKREITNENKK